MFHGNIRDFTITKLCGMSVLATVRSSSYTVSVIS